MQSSAWVRWSVQAALVVVVGLSLGAAAAALPPHLSAERLMWKVINYTGWYWWGFAIVLSAIGLYQMARLSPPTTKWGVVARLFLLLGFAGYLFCWGNSALGTASAFLTLIGAVMVIKQMADECAKTRPKGENFASKMLVALTTELESKNEHLRRN